MSALLALIPVILLAVIALALWTGVIGKLSHSIHQED
jgi:hypothetical protein